MVRVSKQFIKSSILYTIAGSLQPLSALILLPFYLYCLPLAVYGELAIYLAFSMLVQVLVTYSFDNAVYVYYHEYKKQPETLSRFLSSSFIWIGGMGALAVVIFSLIGSWIFGSVYEEKDISFFPFGFASVITAVFQAYFKVNNSLLQSSEKPVLFLWSNLVSFGLIAAFTIIGLTLYPGSLIGPVGGRLLAMVISGGWVIVRNFSKHGFQFDYQLLKRCFQFNNSTYIYQLQQWLINYFDRLLITLYLTLEAVGAYDFSFKCLSVIDFIIVGLFSSFYPKVIGIITEQEKKQSTPAINRYYHGLTAVIMLLICGCILVFPMILELGMFKTDYSTAIPYISLLGVVYLLRSMRYFFNSPYGALKYSRPLPLIYLGISAIKIGLIVLFIRQYELYAIIGSALVCGVLEIIWLKFAIRKKFQFQYNPFKLVVAPALLGCVIIAGEWTDVFGMHVRHSLYLALCIGTLWWFYRNELKLIKPLSFLKI